MLGTGCSRAADGVAPGPDSPAEKAGDKYVLPQGAGTRDGSSWANALAGASLQQGWNALAPGGTLWVGSGHYPGGRLTISSGGAAGKLKLLAGKDTGGGLPVFSSDFDKREPAKTGGVFINATNGADYWAVQDIAVQDYGIGLASKEGGHEGVRIRNFDVLGCREGMSLSGGGTFANPDSASHDWEIRDCDFKNFTKRGIRFKNGNYNVKVIACLADAGGKDWATEPFHMGFSMEGSGAHEKAEDGAAEHDITFINCVAQNAYNDTRRYWNGDGFCAERYVRNLTFIHCFAFDNTDGGWDLKAENVRLENCVAIGNKKNYRFWGKSTTLVNTLSAYPVYPGGTDGSAGLWTNGVVDIDRCTFLEGAITPDAGAKVTVTNSIIARTRAHTGAAPLGEKPGLTLRNTVLWDEVAGGGENPGFVAPVSSGDGQGTAFNSRLGPARGYFNIAAPMPRFTRTPLAPGLRGGPDPAPGGAGTAPGGLAATPEQQIAGAALQPQLQNGSFEDGLTGWAKAKAPDWQIKTEGAAHGQKYASISTPNRSEAEVKLTGLGAGQKYTLTFRSRGNTSRDARIIVRGGPENQYLARTAPSVLPAWTPASLTFTAPAAEVALQVSVRAPGGFDLDDFVLQRAG